jgi:peptidoglycan/xylan/chitin deacetylase (PgdA/CDA1 family)
LGYPIPVDFQNEIKKKFVYLPNKRMLMNLNEISTLIKNGFHVGSHTANHKILIHLNKKEQECEIKNSVQFFREKIGEGCKYLAYPNGMYDMISQQLLNQYSIKYGFTTEQGYNLTKDDRLKIKRIGINPSDFIPLLLFKLFMHSIQINLIVKIISKFLIEK